MRAIVLVMTVIILVAISALIVNSLTSTFTFDDVITSGTNTNETLAAVDNLTTTNFAAYDLSGTATCVLSNVANETSGELISSGNYTQPTTCQILAVSGSEYIGVGWNVTYDYTNTQTDEGIINTTWVAEQFGLFVTALLGFLAVIGVIIAIVWLIMYLKELFSPKAGIQTFGDN